MFYFVSNTAGIAEVGTEKDGETDGRRQGGIKTGNGMEQHVHPHAPSLLV